MATALLLAGGLGTRATLWVQPLDGAARELDLGDVQANPELSVARTGAVAFIGCHRNASGRTVRDGFGEREAAAI